MIPPDALVLLDTNVVLQLVRNNATGQAIDQKYSLTSRRETPIISIVTVGEARAFAAHLGWGEERIQGEWFDPAVK